MEAVRPRFQTTDTARSLVGMRCLVLGAGGFIGTNLCKALCAAGAEVQGFGRGVTFPEGLDPRVVWMPGQFSDIAAVAKAVQGQDVVFHLISGSTPASSNTEIGAGFCDSIRTTLALLDM